MLGGKNFLLKQKELAVSRPKSWKQSRAADRLLKEEAAGPCLDLIIPVPGTESVGVPKQILLEGLASFICP